MPKVAFQGSKPNNVELPKWDFNIDKYKNRFKTLVDVNS